MALALLGICGAIACGKTGDNTSPPSNERQVEVAGIHNQDPTLPRKAPEWAGEHFDDESNGRAVESASPPPAPAEPRIDEAKAAAAGIRKLGGKHLTLYTDLPPTEEIEELPAVFDQAVAQWEAYFQLDPAAAENWRMTGYLINDRDRFRAAGLLPDDLPPFLHGFHRGRELWLYEQPSAYYRRHLLLHEGTHGFMDWALGGAGPPWFMEGVAELLGTHLWENGELTLGHFPRDRNETPYWGRIKIIQDELAAGRGMTLAQIMNYDSTAHRRTEPYAWCWAAAAFFDNHPRYQEPFRELRYHVRDRSFNFSRRFYEKLEPEWPHINQQWQLFIINIDYGYDIARAAIDPKPTRPLPAGGATVEIAADRGWQSTGFRLEAGATYEITASGRYQVADQPKIWWCEPNGVTIRYYRGRPLGMLLGAVSDPEEATQGVTPLASPEPIGLGRQLQFGQSGTLYLCINESPAELADNAGRLTVHIAPL